MLMAKTSSCKGDELSLYRLMFDFGGGFVQMVTRLTMLFESYTQAHAGLTNIGLTTVAARHSISNTVLIGLHGLSDDQ